jgi:hypothetical protein
MFLTWGLSFQQPLGVRRHLIHAGLARERQRPALCRIRGGMELDVGLIAPYIRVSAAGVLRGGVAKGVARERATNVESTSAPEDARRCTKQP